MQAGDPFFVGAVRNGCTGLIGEDTIEAVAITVSYGIGDSPHRYTSALPYYLLYFTKYSRLSLYRTVE